SKQFLNDSTNSLCLMVRDGHKIRFSHRSFQEYFTGLYIVEQTEPNEWYGKITEMITFGNREIFTLLEFMFGIKKTKFEDWVIRPYLNEILSGTDYNEGYEKFLLTLFPTIGCEVGEVGCLLADRDYFPSLYALIRYKRGFNREYKIAESELPFYPEFVQDEVYLCKGEEDDSNLYTVPGRLIGDSLQIIDENPVGYYLSIPTKKVLAKPEKYPDLYAALMNDEFTLKTEFFKMKRYLKTLEDRATKPKMALLRGKRK
ncbi:MAG: hypothetical protein HUJ54_09430, partial [Erysipelotrichaceae bacterium]|nr:hypothetical protein [Erysipelotrichaceae bacterium]